MKRNISAHGAQSSHSSATTFTQHDVFAGLKALACLLAFAFALLFAFGINAWATQNYALADDTAQLTTSDEGEDSSEGIDGSGDSEDEGSESSEASEGSEDSESSEASSSSESSEKEDEGDEEPELGGLLLRVVDIDMAKKSGVEDGDLTGSQGDATLQGMKFNVYNEKGKLVKTMVADDDGLADLEEADYLPLGTYTVKQVAESARSLGYKENKTWAGKGQKVTIEFAGDVADVGTCQCEVVRGAVRVNMVDSDLYDVLGVEDTGQGKASLAEAKFEVYNASSKAVLVGNTYYNPYNEWSDANDPIMELTTNEWGVATSDEETGIFDSSRGLPWGTYVIKQKEISKGYHAEEEELDAWWAKVEVRGEDRFNLSEPVRATVIRGGVKLQMVDADTEDGKAQGDASLKGATFEVVNDNGEDGVVVLDGKAYGEGDVLLKMTTTKEGLATSAKKILPYGTYKVRMAKNKKFRSYVYDKDWQATANVKKNDRRAKVNKGKPFKAKVARGGVTVKLLDSESHKPVEGATIEIVNNSNNPAVVKGSTYEKGKVVLTFSSDAKGVAKTAKNVLPYGKYILRESKAAPGYDLSKDWDQDFQIRRAGKIVNAGKAYETLSPVLVETGPDKGGRANTILPILGILVVAAAVAGAIVYRRRRQQEEELLAAALPGAGAAAVASGVAAGNAASTFAGEETEALANTGRMAAIDAEATRALIDDQATRAMQATLASRAAREGGPARAHDAMSAETAALSAGVPQVTQAMPEAQGAETTYTPRNAEAASAMRAPQNAEATRAMRASLEAVTIPLVNAAHANQPMQPIESKDPTQPNYLDRAFESLEPEKPEDPTEPNRFAQAIEADQRTRVMPSAQASQGMPDAQGFDEGYEDDQEFGTILPAVVTKSEQKRARRASRWGKHQ